MRTEVFPSILTWASKAYAYRTDLHISQNYNFDVEDRL
jgi:hypothetical protein